MSITSSTIAGTLSCAVGPIVSAASLKWYLKKRELAKCAMTELENALGEMWISPVIHHRYEGSNDIYELVGVCSSRVGRVRLETRLVCALARIEARRRRDGNVDLKKKHNLLAYGALHPRKVILRGQCRWQQASGVDGDEIWVLHSPASLPEVLGSRIWPATEQMLDFLRRHHDFGRRCSVLELGAGAGVLGLTLARRAKAVSITDCDPQCLALLRAAVALRSTSSVDGNAKPLAEINVAPLSFGERSVRGLESTVYDLVVASDVQYDAQDAPTITPCNLSVGAACWGMWETVSSLLWDYRRAGAPCLPQFLLGFMHRHRHGPDDILSEAKRRGFEVSEVSQSYVEDPAAKNVKNPLVLCSVYLFSRRL